LLCGDIDDRGVRTFGPPVVCVIPVNILNVLMFSKLKLDSLAENFYLTRFADVYV